nr:alpha-amylase family glycosyl hydrolase [Micromonospora sp. DSM 115978]
MPPLDQNPEPATHPASATSPEPVTSPAPDRQAHGADLSRRWWRDAVLYQVYLRSFADSDGDGVGDLGGLRTRLPYLADLGVDGLWITP